jgi:hypothetical protein
MNQTAKANGKSSQIFVSHLYLLKGQLITGIIEMIMMTITVNPGTCFER